MRRVVLLALLGACGDNKQPLPPLQPFVQCDVPIPGRTVEMRLVARVPDAALLVTSPPRDTRLFVVQQHGAIHIIENGAVVPQPFLDLSEDSDGPVVFGVENGLLGLAFHPQYATNGQFFVTYTQRRSGDPDNDQQNVLARCTASADPNRADRSSCVEVLVIPDLAGNHNGGMIEFGADGFLYYATGDGGTGGAPSSQALVDGDPLPNTQALHGKILRLDVDHKAAGLEYGIPADNPYANGGGRPEIFIRGLRNPWRWSFDRATGDMWIGDVGQKTYEELTVLRPGQQAGANLGWAVWEGTNCYGGTEACGALTSSVFPQQLFPSVDGWYSIIGGQVYRGSCFPDLVGTYFFTDYDDQGRLATAVLNDDDSLTVTELDGEFPPLGASLHEDATGELYETDTNGNVFQLVVAGP